MPSAKLNHLLKQLQFNYLYLLDLIKDIEEKDMTHTPAKGLENHPTFTVGHIITAYGMMIKKLGGEYTISKEWDDLFRRKGPGDPRYPNKDINLYPAKEVLILELKKQHTTLLKYIEQMDESTLDKAVEWRFDKYFPKTIDLFYFMLLNHYALHIGQLGAWRRAMDMPSSLSRM